LSRGSEGDGEKANPPPAAHSLAEGFEANERRGHPLTFVLSPEGRGFRVRGEGFRVRGRNRSWRMNKRGYMVSNSKGFTLTELMICVAVIGLLAVTVIIIVGNSIRRANENVARGNLGILRMAIMTYYGTNEGVWPSNPLSNVLIPDYVNEIPYLNLNDHPRTNQVIGPNITDSGGWCYNSATGKICIDCTHLGLDGTQISGW
jgi:prepilin-type N-terminal cleavage/methylation domain-containing protein